MIMAIIFAALGAFCIFNGVKTILTGSLSAVEESRLKDYSKKGAKTYKLVYGITNILGGLLVIGLGVLKFLEEKNIAADMMPFRIGALVFALILAAFLLIFRAKCKKMTDDE